MAGTGVLGLSEANTFANTCHLSEVISHMPVSGQQGSSSLQDARATFGLPDKSGSSGDRRSLSTDDTDIHRAVGRDAGREFDSIHVAPPPVGPQ